MMDSKEDKSPNSQSFADRLKKRRKKIGISQVRLAEMTGINKSTIKNYEYGGGTSGENIIEIARALKCTTDWLLTGVGEPDGVCGPKSAEASASLSPAVNTVEIQQIDLVRKFKNKALAKQINLNLIEIEKINPAALKSLADKIDGVLMGLKISEGNKENDILKAVANGGEK